MPHIEKGKFDFHKNSSQVDSLKYMWGKFIAQILYSCWLEEDWGQVDKM